MQRINRYLYCAIIAIVAIGCDKIEDPWGDKFVIPQTLSARTAEFDAQATNSKSNAIYEYQPVDWDTQANIETRTYAVVDPSASNEYYQYWSEGDAISVFYTTANLKYVLQSYNELDHGVFTHVSGDPNQGEEFISEDYYYGVYPYKDDTEMGELGNLTFNFPSIQSYSNNSYASGANGMIAIEPYNGTDNILEFKNFCSYLQLPLTSKTNKRVDKITLTAKNGNPISGEGVIYIKNNIPYVKMSKGGSNTITLDCGGITLSNDSENPTYFWFVLPALKNNEFIGYNFQEGFDITVSFIEGPTFRKSTTNNISIARNHIKPMTVLQVDTKINQEATIIYKYKDPSINTTGLVLKNSDFTDINGNQLVYNQVFNEETKEWEVFFDGDLNTIEDNAFEFNADLDYIIVQNVKELDIASYAFWGCTAESIEFYNNIDEVGSNAFSNSNLTDIHFYEDIKSIGTNAFLGSAVQNLTIDGTIQNIDAQAFFGCSGLNTISLHGIETIAAAAFQMCYNLSSVEISTDSDTILRLGEGVFAGCKNLTIVKLNAEIPPVFVHNNTQVDNHPYTFPEQTTIYVPSTDDYNDENYQYPTNDLNAKNDWPKYYSNQIAHINNIYH